MTSHLYKKWFDIDLHHLLKFLTVPQSLNGEHSFVGAPASLYNLTKSASDPLEGPLQKKHTLSLSRGPILCLIRSSVSKRVYKIGPIKCSKG